MAYYIYIYNEIVCKKNYSENAMNYKQKLFFLTFLVLCLLTLKLAADSTKTRWSFSSFGEDDFFFRPSDIEVDFKQSLIYIADSGNHRVVVFDLRLTIYDLRFTTYDL